MKKLLLAITTIAAFVACVNTADAGTTTVEDFRGTVQDVSTTGTTTISLGANTTIVNFTGSSDVYAVGMDGGYNGRIVLFTNSGTGNAYFYHEHAGASSAGARWLIDANTGYRIMYASSIGGFGIATYNSTTQRWRFTTIMGYNTGGGLAVQGDLTGLGNVSFNGSYTGSSATLSDLGANTRLSLKSISSTNDGSTVRWKNYLGNNLFSMGPDYNGNGGKDWWLYDNYNGINNILIKNTGISYLSFGTSYGGMQYDESINELGLYAGGTIKMRIGTSYDGAIIKLNAMMVYRRANTTEAKPALSNCGTSPSQHADSSDWRGSITLGSAATSCTMTFVHPFDITSNNSNQGFPICTATPSAGTATVTNVTDHAVTFGTSVAGATIYYHCDGISPPAL